MTEKIIGDITEEQVAEAMEHSPALWVLKHGIRTESGVPIEFTKRKFLFEMYNDLSPLQVRLKPPQIGETLENIVKSFWVAKKLKKDIIYTLPTGSDIQDMAGGKINRVIAQNPLLLEWVKDHDTVEQKGIGDNIIYYRGTYTTKAAMMVSSQLNIHDEVDASDPSVITQYETRLEGTAGGWRWYFSHPSLAGHGVDIYWQQSDKKEWFVTCPLCGHDQILTWPDNIDLDRKIYICSHCKEEMSDDTRINGYWKATATGKFSGFHVSQLMLYWKTAETIIEAFNDPTKDKQYFWNYVLGLPYAASDDRIDASVVLKNCTDIVNPQEGRTIIGMDTGHGIHYCLMNKDGIFYYDYADGITASTDPYDVIESHLKRFPRSIVVSDQGGDLIGIRKLQAKYPGRVFLCFYRRDRKSLDLVQWGEGDNYGQVTVDRNRMMTLLVEQLRDIGRVRLNGTPDEWRTFAEHFGNLYREKIEVKEMKDRDNKELYGAEYVWKHVGPDHFAHAALYATVGLQRYGGEMAKIVGNDPLQGIPKGHIVDVQEVASFVSAADFRGERANL